MHYTIEHTVEEHIFKILIPELDIIFYNLSNNASSNQLCKYIRT